ncbi:non-ribosomal peptide synthetase [Nocardia terpenica]|uniref:Non-ribosomal peptide synthetase n=1 Tax=Nocardia terpenica TaxID=455432 RepID=A0A291RMF4_9NOCA|nr:non-ribosomal peptide synthetase [Nocardia terpenica]ATL68753.1 non-ribosomal peptide synthetase [Nocardia terpenica]
MVPTDRSEVFLLNGYQRDIWAAELRNPGGPQFTVVVHESLAGRVDIGRLGECVRRAVGRRDAFGLRFEEDEAGNPQARRVSGADAAPAVVDLSGDADPGAAVRRWCADRLGEGFDLRSGQPLYRAAILVESATATHLFFETHHLVSDSWGLNVLTSEILTDYETGTAAADAPSYAESVDDYDKYRNSPEYQRDRDFYRDYLDGAAPALFSRTGVGRADRGRCSFVIEDKFVRRILEDDMSPFAYLAAALAICLGRVHRAEEIVVGVPFLNRRGDRQRDLVAQFANNLPLRVPTAEEVSLNELAGRIGTTVRTLREHERLPFGEILRALPAAGADRRQLFDVTLSYLHFPRPQPISGVAVTTTMMAPVHDTHALSIMVQAFDGEQQLRVDLDYARDVFDGDFSAQALGVHVTELIRQGLEVGELPTKYLSMLTDDEYENAVRGNQGALVEYSSEKTLHRSFAEQAARTPEAAAVVDDASGDTLTYRQLERRSNQVARALRAAGVGPGERVAIMARRGPELLPGLLGILKAGGAYVPVDPSYPPDRIRMLLADCAPAAVLTSAGVDPGAALPAVLRVAELWHGSDDALTPTGTAEDVAYVIYTSGSTGRPKGVMVEHHAVANRLMWMQRRYPIGPGDTLLQKTPISFDVSVWELFWWGQTGARVALLPPGAEKDPREIVRAVGEHAVTAVHFVPSMLGPFLETLAEDPALRRSVASLRYVFCSGEALPAQRVNQFHRIFDERTALVNLYGPTEAAVDVTAFECPSAATGPVTRVPIGTPVDNTAVYVLGKHDRPQPVGVPGELCIGGVQVARGYLDRPDLTAQRFGADPFRPAGRLYRTGDLGRFLADGTIEYLGRIDDQVKIRGNRVELGEVHNALVALADIRDAVVIDRESADRGRVLVAYYVADRERDHLDLRSRLAQSLPDYMIPSHFVRIDRVPLTPNGKADRRRLPELSGEAVGGGGDEPRDEREATLARIWAQVLGVRRVGIHSDYFAVGGDSITMLRVRALAERAGIRFGLDEFVANPTVAALAARGEAAAAPEPRPALAPFALVSHVDRARLGGYEDAYPVTRLQLGLLFHSRERQGSATYRDVFRYSLELPWNDEVFRTCFDALVARHPALRSSFDLGGYSEPLQIVHRAIDPAVDVVDLRDAPPESAEARIHDHIERRRHYDYRFERPGLHHLRAFLLPGTVELVLSFHHAILDGGSVANLVSELLRDYTYALGLHTEPVQCKQLPSPALYVVEERRAEASQRSRDHWRAELRDADPVRLEGFRPHEPADERQALVVRDLTLDADLTAAVHAVARDRRVPVKSVLFAAHVTLLRVFGGRDDVTTGLVTHGRPEVEDAEHLCGLFLNTVPVRARTAPRTWFDTVHEVLARERDAYPHRRVPLAVIQGDTGHSQLVDTAFNFIHFRQLGDVFRLPGIADRGFLAWEETNFALLINAMLGPADDGIRVRIDGSPRLFTEAQGDLYADTFVRILRAIAERPDEPADRSVFAPAIDGPRPARPHADAVRAFLSHARHTPAVEALVAADEVWTYADVELRSARIARSLVRSGARPGDRIGIAMARSPRSVVARLAVARAGCSAVPLDVSYPPERLRYMIEQSAPSHIVAEDEHAHLFGDATVTSYDALLDLSHDRDDDTVALPEISPDDEAYLLFTSGSTGQPKAVAMPHRSLANLVAWQNGIASGAVGGRTLHYAPLSFDVSFQEMYSTLCGGGALVIAPDELRRDMPELLRFIDREAVERVYMPFVALQRLAEAADTLGITPRGLRIVCSSGEQLRLTEELRRFCAALGPDLVLENQYGPTETHVTAAYAMTGDAAAFPDLPPIGHPIDGAQVLVLDDRGRPVPVGAKGEIFLGGAVLADGYAGRPALTEERFVPNPHGRPGERLYRTGDIGMLLPDGAVVTLGRADRQVKIRGYRVEPAEAELAIAEAAAATAAAIGEIAVVPRRDRAGDAFLAAFLVGDAERTDLTALGYRLRERLPDYLVPTHYEWISAIPLTPSGKRDDAALRDAPLTRIVAADRVPPRDDYERALAEILIELLGVPDIGVHDNLFDLGATSVTAMRTVVLVEHRFGVGIPLSRFITSPTIADLAIGLRDSDVRAAEGHSGFDPLVTIKADGDRPPLFYVHPMGGNVLCYVPFTRHLPADRPFYAFQAAGSDSGTRPVRGVERLAADYIAAMRRVQPAGPYHIGGWSFGGFVAFEMARQLRAAGESIGSLVLLDTTALNPDRSSWTDDEALLGWFFWELLWLQRGGNSPEIRIPAELRSLVEKFEFMTELAVAEGVLPKDSSGAVVRRLFRLYEANWRAAFDYHPEVVDQDMVLVRAKQPLPSVLRSMHTAIDSLHTDPANGWGQRTSGRLTVLEVEGDHLTLMEEPYVAATVDAIIGTVTANSEQAEEI